MKNYLYFFMALLLVLSSCGKQDKAAGMKKIDATIKKLKSIEPIDADDAVAMVKHALDPSLRRDWSMGLVASDDLRTLTGNPAFRQLILLRANDLKTNEPKTIAAIYFAPAEGTPPGQADIRYGNVTVCPPPDGSTCLKDQLDIAYP